MKASDNLTVEKFDGRWHIMTKTSGGVIVYSSKYESEARAMLAAWDKACEKEEHPNGTRHAEATVKGISFEIAGTYDYDPGCHTMRNGDPGWPSSRDIEITSLKITDEHTLIDVLFVGVTIEDIEEAFGENLQ